MALERLAVGAVERCAKRLDSELRRFKCRALLALLRRLQRVKVEERRRARVLCGRKRLEAAEPVTQRNVAELLELLTARWRWAEDSSGLMRTLGIARSFRRPRRAGGGRGRHRIVVTISCAIPHSHCALFLSSNSFSSTDWLPRHRAAAQFPRTHRRPSRVRGARPSRSSRRPTRRSGSRRIRRIPSHRCRGRRAGRRSSTWVALKRKLRELPELRPRLHAYQNSPRSAPGLGDGKRLVVGVRRGALEGVHF